MTSKRMKSLTCLKSQLQEYIKGAVPGHARAVAAAVTRQEALSCAPERVSASVNTALHSSAGTGELPSLMGGKCCTDRKPRPQGWREKP